MGVGLGFFKQMKRNSLSMSIFFFYFSHLSNPKFSVTFQCLGFNELDLFSVSHLCLVVSLN